MKNKKILLIPFAVMLGGLAAIWAIDAGISNVDSTFTNNTQNNFNIDNDTGGSSSESISQIYTSASGTTFALTSSGALFSWGKNVYGQAGVGNTNMVTSPTVIFDGTGESVNGAIDASIASVVTTNRNTMYALTTNGDVYAWGANDYGQVGDGAVGGNVTTPQLIISANNTGGGVVNLPANDQVTQVTTNLETTFAVTSTGQVYSWGQNIDGLLGIYPVPTAGYVDTPTLIVNPGSVGTSPVDATIGTLYSNNNGTMFALSQDEESLYSWGLNLNGETGDAAGIGDYVYIPLMNLYTPSVTNPTAGTQVPAKITNVYTNKDGTTFAQLSNGDLYSWGVNNQGQLGIGNPLYINSDTPTLVFNSGTGSGIIQNTGIQEVITAGGSTVESNGYVSNVIALTTDGSVYSWGNNGYGQVGNSTSGGTFNTPQLIISGDNAGGGIVNLPANDTITNIYSANGGTNYAIDSNGDLYAWGNNDDGQVGSNATSGLPVTTPQLILGTSNATVDIPSGYSIDGLELNSMYASNNQQTTAYATATNTSGDQMVYAWGRNQYGEVGNGESGNNIYLPTIISDSTGSTPGVPATGVTSIVTGGNDVLSSDTFFSTTYAIADNGSLYSWGSNNTGQIGDGSTTDVTTPTLVLDLNIGFSSVTDTINSSNNTVDISYSVLIPSWAGALTSVSVTLYNATTNQAVANVPPNDISTPTAGSTQTGQFNGLPVGTNYYLRLSYTIGGANYAQNSNILYIDPAEVAFSNTTTSTPQSNGTSIISFGLEVPTWATIDNSQITATIYDTSTGQPIAGVNPVIFTPANGTNPTGEFVISQSISSYYIEIDYSMNGTDYNLKSQESENSVSPSVNVNDVSSTINSNDTTTVNYTVNINSWEYITNDQVIITIYDGTTGTPITGVDSTTITSSDGNTYNGQFTIPSSVTSFYIQTTYGFNGETINNNSPILQSGTSESDVDSGNTNNRTTYITVLWVLVAVLGILLTAGVLAIYLSGGFKNAFSLEKAKNKSKKKQKKENLTDNKNI